MASTPPHIRQERPESPDSELSTASPAGSEHNRSSFFGEDESLDQNMRSPQSPQSPQSPRSPQSSQSPQLLSPLQPVRSTPIVPIMDSNSISSGSPNSNDDDDDDNLANSPSDHGNNAEPTVTQFQQDQQNRSSPSPFLPATVFQGSNNNHNSRRPQLKTPEPRNNNSTTPTNEPITITNQNSNDQGNHNHSLHQTLNPIQTSINPTPRNILAAHTLSSPSTPGTLPNFDWDDFVTRYTESLEAADAQEQELLQEFQQLVQYFNVWASSSSAHDTDRAVKRLQTRERYVRLSEQNLAQRRKHLTEVVRAFQSALALLSQSS